MTQAKAVTEHNVVNPVSTDANGDVATSPSGDPVVNVVVADTVVGVDYFTGTIDTSGVNTADILNTEQYSSIILKLAGIPGGVTISVTGDLVEAQTLTTFSTSISFTSNALARANTTANVALVNGTWIRDWAIHYSALRLTVGGTPAAGTCTYHFIGKK